MHNWCTDIGCGESDELFLAPDRQPADSQVPLPAGMRELDAALQGLLGLVLLWSDYFDSVRSLGAQLALHAAVQTRDLAVVLFSQCATRRYVDRLVRQHASDRVTVADVRRRIIVPGRSARPQGRLTEPPFRSVVEDAKRETGTSRCVVLVDDPFRYRRPPKRRTWNHKLRDDSFTKQLRDAQRATGDVWLVVADHMMDGCFDTVLEYQVVHRTGGRERGVLTVLDGVSHEEIGYVALEIDNPGGSNI